jgi:hypothetical protein
MLKYQWYEFRRLVHYNIGQLSESSLKHRGAILFLSVAIIFIDPDVSLTLGSASLAGLGISVEPPQSIPVAPFLFSLLIYRLTAFWASIVLDNRTDTKKTHERISLHYEDDYEDCEINTTGDMISHETDASTYHWGVRKILWDILPPNILALYCTFKFMQHYLF